MKRLAFVTAGLLLAGSAQAGPNLVVNGSFEQGTGGIGSFSGWSTRLGDPFTFVDSSGQTGTHFGQASAGLWAAYFGSTQADGGASISQTIATVAGQRYVLGFDLANDNGGAAALNAFAASIGGVALFTANGLANQDYVHESVAFFGNGTTTTLAFAGFNDNSYLQLDNVTVAAVPEPATWSLLAGGALLAAAGRRRSKSEARLRVDA